MSSPVSVLESRTTIDDLEQSIKSRCQAINALTYELLVDIRHFDQRAGWLKWGLSNCAEWLHSHCEIALGTAREKVRSAHALAQLPEIATAFSKGILSWSKVKELTRVASPENEEGLVAFASKHTTRQVEDRCRELRCGTEASINDATVAHARRSLSMFRNRDKGTMTITVELPLEQGELIDKALDKARDDTVTHGPELDDKSWSSRQADAFVEMARSYLNGDFPDTSNNGTGDNYLVTVHVDQQALAEDKGRAGLPLETVKRLCCDGQTVTIIENGNGEPLNIGRKTRTVPTAIARAVRARDRHCRFPGCHNSRFVDAHHIEHWSNGGETSIDNLMLLCDKHHRLVHEGGFRIDKDFQGRWTFFRPDGIAVPHGGYQLEDIVDDDINETSEEVSNSHNYARRRAYLSEAEKTAIGLIRSRLDDRSHRKRSFR